MKSGSTERPNNPATLKASSRVGLDRPFATSSWAVFRQGDRNRAPEAAL